MPKTSGLWVDSGEEATLDKAVAKEGLGYEPYCRQQCWQLNCKCRDPAGESGLGLMHPFHQIKALISIVWEIVEDANF